MHETAVITTYKCDVVDCENQVVFGGESTNPPKGWETIGLSDYGILDVCPECYKAYKLHLLGTKDEVNADN